MRQKRLPLILATVAVLVLALVRSNRTSAPVSSAADGSAASRSANLLSQIPLLSTLPVAVRAMPASVQSSRIFPIVDASAGVPKFSDSKFPNRLRNTSATLDQLVHRDSAILLLHALMDTASAEPLAVPASLRSEGDPGLYIVQAHQALDGALRRTLQQSGARIISYIPNNALLVRADARVAAEVSNHELVSAVVPFEPYFKLDSGLLDQMLQPGTLPTELQVVATVSGDEIAVSSVEAIIGSALGRSRSPFGTLLTLQVTPESLTVLARHPDVTGIEVSRPRALANDLTGYLLGSVTDTNNTLSYLGLTGKGVVMGLNDLGVDFSHVAIRDALLPVDLSIQAILEGRGNAHGTHVAGILVGNGAGTILNQPQGSSTNATMRGRAPGAKLFVQPVDLNVGPTESDEYLQTNAVAKDVYISNNSWAYRGVLNYNSSSASFDAAVRDSLPGVTGAQPVIYVFSAGNEGSGDDIGTGGLEDTISAPSNAKNVITVGALESFRNLTNDVVTDTNGVIIAKNQIKTNAEPGTYTTNKIFTSRTDSAAQVAAYSSRGNVGVGTEGESGRFKPDVVAPGSFIVSARGKGFNLTNQLAPGSLEYEGWLELQNDLGGDAKDPNLVNRYRYETGTSMAAPAVSGILAQMQEYFEVIAKTNRPSPALARALLINGARPTSDSYAVDPHEVINYAGWGLASLPNSLPGTGVTNFNKPPAPLLFIEESYTNAIGTGQSKTWRVKFNKANTNTSSAVLRATLVWTDPPGNPAASVKLVNDLDLIITSKTTNAGVTSIYYGNDYLPNLNRTRARERAETAADPTAPPAENAEDPTKLDRINNVENITLEGLEDEYLISVVGRRVNVQSLGKDNPGQPTNEVTLQDWVLVISVEAPNPNGVIDEFQVAAAADQMPRFIPPVDMLTNGLPRLRERVGANGPRLDGVEGQLAQWHFYTFTNYSDATNANGIVYGSNVAFVIFGSPNLAVSRAFESDVDLYVTLDRNLTNLNPATVASTFRSVGRTGSELVLFTNAPNTNEIFYIGVKSEDQQAAEYNIVGLSSDQPFSRLDPDGRIRFPGFPLLQPIPDGEPRRPGRGIYMAIGAAPGELRNILVEQTWTHELFSDVLGNLDHDRQFAVLNNRHEFGNERGGTNRFRLYGDSFAGGSLPVYGRYVPGLQNIETFQTNSYVVDGPGSLNNFLGERMDGAWIFSSFDNAAGFGGRVNQLDIRVFPNDLLDGRFRRRRVLAGACELEVMNVPADVSRMRVIITNITPALPLNVLIRRAQVPDLVDVNNNDKTANFLPPGGEVSIGVRDIPPLVAGRYFVAVCNPNSVAIEYDIAILLERNLDARFTRVVTGGNLFTNRDLSLGTVLTNIDDSRRVTSVRVGVRIDQPQVSDLKVQLVNNNGRAVVAENRGLRQATQYGSDLVTSNFQHVAVTYDDGSAVLRLFYNGLKVAETVARGLVLPTNSSLHFGRDPSKLLIGTKVPLGMDDLGLWRRAISDNEVREIFDEGAFSRGKNLVDRSRLLTGHWRFDGRGDEGVSGYDAVMVGSFTTIPGQIGLAMRFTGEAEAIVDSSAVSSLNLAARGRSGFTIEGWIHPYEGVQDVVVAAFYDGKAASKALPALMVGPKNVDLKSPGPGALTAVFLNTNGALVTLSSAPGLVTPEGLFTNVIHAQFTDSTNSAFLPIKFVPPPFSGYISTNVRYLTNSFETTAAGNHPTNSLVDGWLVISNSVAVENDPAYAIHGNRYLRLQRGAIRRQLTTIPGQIYEVEFATRRSKGEAEVPEVELHVDGLLDRVIKGTAQWRTNFLSFRAFREQTELEFRPRPLGQSVPDMEIDNLQAIQASGTIAYLPEEPLLPLLGRPGTGDWRIELTDDRGGVSDAILRSWQLTFTFAPTNTPAVRLTNNLPYSSCATGPSLKNDALQYYYVDVPIEALAVTNILKRLSGSPVDLLYSSSGLPDGNQEDDVVLLRGGVGTEAYGLTTATPPLLRRGRRYYLAVRNSNPFDSESCHEITVQFGVPIVRLTNCVPYKATIRNEGLISFYSVIVPADAIAMNVSVTNMNEDVNLVIRREPGFPSQSVNDYSSENSGLTEERISLSTGSQPVALEPGLWYIGVYPASTNLNVRDLTFTLTACTAVGEKTQLVDGVSLIKTNTLNVIQYFCVDVTVPSLSLEVLVEPLQGNVDAVLAFNRVPDASSYDAISASSGSNIESFLVRRDGTPPLRLTTGRWWVGVYPVGAVPVRYRISATIVPDDGSIIDLFEGLPFERLGEASPATNYYRFSVTSDTDVTGVGFDLFNLTGNADLYARLGALPRPDRPFFASTNPGTQSEAINLTKTGVPGGSLIGDWYLAVVLRDAASLDYTIMASFQTAPPVTNSIIAVIRPGLPGQPPVISFNSIPGVEYAIECTDVLNPATWLEVTKLTATATTTEVSLPVAAVQGNARFYRVVQLSGSPPPPPPPPPIVIDAKITLGAPGQPPSITFNSTVGVKYSIECSPVVPAGSWLQVVEVTAEGSTTTVTLPAAAVQAAVQFYRVVQSSGSPPPPPPPPPPPRHPRSM